MMKADDDSSAAGGGVEEPKRDVSKMKPAVAGTSHQQSHNDAFNRRKAKKDAAANGEVPENEPFGDKMKRLTSNCCTKMGLCCFKFKKQSQITALEYKITTRQKKFGVDYLNLVQDKAPQNQLKECLRDALKDISVLQEQMNEHFDKIDDKADEADSKIQQREKEAMEEAGGGGEEKRERPKKQSTPERTKSNPTKKKKGGDPGSGEEQEAGEAPKAQPKRTKSKTKKKNKSSGSASSRDSNFSIDDE